MQGLYLSDSSADGAEYRNSVVDVPGAGIAFLEAI